MTHRVSLRIIELTGIFFTRHCSPVCSLRYCSEVKLSANCPTEYFAVRCSLPLKQQLVPRGPNMEVSGRGHRTLPVKTGESGTGPQIKSRGPCPLCKQYFPELKLGPFLKHRHHCKGEIIQRQVTFSPPGRYNDSRLSTKKHPDPFCSNWQPESTFADPHG